MSKETKVRFFRWTGTPRPFFYHVWKIREDGSGDGIYFNGRRTSKKDLQINKFISDPDWEEIQEHEAALIL